MLVVKRQHLHCRFVLCLFYVRALGHDVAKESSDDMHKYASVLATHVVNAMSCRGWSMQYHSMAPPDNFASLLSEDEAVVAASLAQLEAQCRAILKAEVCSEAN